MTPNLTVVVAMQSIDVGVAADGGPLPDGALPALGWDLDKVCTCPGPPSCVQAAGTVENCDDEAGRDHTGLELFRKLGMTAQAGNATANEAMRTGQYGLVVEMTGYNGTPNDTQVTVAIYASSGVLGTGDGGTTQLQHDGTDKWTLDPRYLQFGTSLMSVNADCEANTLCTPIFADVNAYVTKGVLVASYGDVPITFGGRANIGGAVMDLSNAYLVGTLSAVSLPSNGTSWAIVDGSISGRWGSAKLLSNMATIVDPTQDSGAYLCGSNVNYGLLKGYICSLQDIPSDLSHDNMGASCDAISMAFGFTAEPARLGVVAPLPATPAGCTSGPDGGIPFHDVCQGP
jgi:hypothetical protein